MQKEGLFRDMPSKVYHGTKDTWSSSQLKVILDDEEEFFDLYIAKTKGKDSSEAFDVGNYVHTAILEPEKLAEEYIVYPGKQRRGAQWDEFKAKYEKTHIIMTQSNLAEAEGCIAAIRNSPIAMARVQRSESEVSAFLNILIHNGEIYAPSFNLVLGPNGWLPCKKVPTEGRILMVKARADKIAEGDFILDLKTTRGNTKKEKEMRAKVDDLKYELSAALYLDIFSAVTGKKIYDFIWTFASKDQFNSKSYKADPDNILIGRVKWKKAVLRIAELMDKNWEIEETLGILKPSYFQYEHLKEEEVADL